VASPLQGPLSYHSASQDYHSNWFLAVSGYVTWTRYPDHTQPLHERFIHVGLWLAHGQECLEQPHQCTWHQKISAYNLNLTKHFQRSRQFSCTWNLKLLYLHCYVLYSEWLSLTYGIGAHNGYEMCPAKLRYLVVLRDHIIAHHLTAAATSPSTSICYSCWRPGPLLFCRGMPTVWIPVLFRFFFCLPLRLWALQKNWWGASVPETGPVTFANWTMCYMCDHFPFTSFFFFFFFFFQKWKSCFLSAFSLCRLWLRHSKYSGDTSNIFAASQVLWNLGQPTT